MVLIEHAVAPEQPDAPILTNSGQDIVISWVAPDDNGHAITSYTILLQHSDGSSYSEDLVNCDGTDSTIVSAAACTVPLSILTAAPYNLVAGDSIHAKIIASNIKGASIESDTGSGALIITVPDAPININEDEVERTSSTLGISWSIGSSGGRRLSTSEHGYSSIIDYRDRKSVV